MKLILFDIDMTLIYTAGAGRRAMTAAMKDIFGADGFGDVSFAGRTDAAILKDGLTQLKIPWDIASENAFKQNYLNRLAVELRKPGKDKGVKPGIPDIVENLRERTDVVLALLTGNWKEGARLKLEHFGLWHFFEFGVYADDSADRNQLPGIAVSRLRTRRNIDVTARDVFVIGDTPLDIACTKPLGAVSIAVATGFFSETELRAAEPDFLFSDLSDSEAFLNIFA
jgi:phosphoglycolate phosphatase-like HAD superfamily hydrolase